MILYLLHVAFNLSLFLMCLFLFLCIFFLFYVIINKQTKTLVRIRDINTL